MNARTGERNLWTVGGKLFVLPVDAWDSRRAGPIRVLAGSMRHVVVSVVARWAGRWF